MRIKNNFQKYSYALLLILLLFVSNQMQAQGFEPLSKEDSALLYPSKTNFIQRMLSKGIIVLPVAFYSPETKFGAGVAGFYYFRTEKDSITRPSSVNLAAIYTQNGQIIFHLSFSQNKSLLEGEIGTYRYPFQFFGIGNEGVDLDESEIYEPNIVRVKTIFYKKLKDKVFLGPRLRYEYQDMRPFETGGKLDTQDFIGESGGSMLGLGASFLIDKRNNIFNPTKGSYFNITSYGSIDGFVSDYGMTESVLDVRKYFPAGKTSFATQFYLQYQTGDVPFYLLADLGGYSQMRGFFKGAYRDKVFTTAQAEWRFPLFWRFGAVAFGSVGQVNNNLEINPDYFRFAGGAGIRFLFNEKENINLRIDYARGKNTSGFYFTVGEAC
jgi:hypothetical protein